jgi:nucleoside-diphosphate-sugar epimerase
MSSLVVLGASGFLGRAIIAQKSLTFSIKALARRIPADVDRNSLDIRWHEGDLLIPQSLDNVLEEGDVVINAAFLPGGSDIDNLQLINNIIESCLRCGVKRLLHCSTAVVAGCTKNLRIDETVHCLPYTNYEKIKFALEQRVLSCVPTMLEVAILRPTAVIGCNGKNLLKLADSLMNGNPFVNYLRASLFRQRKMHLVSVRNVVSALCHLASMNELQTGSIYHISSDDDPDNNFLAVEKILVQSMGLAERKIPVIPVPMFFLSALLKLLGRSESNIGRIYDSTKLLATNFTPVESIHQAVSEVGKSISSQKNIEGNSL